MKWEWEGRPWWGPGADGRNSAAYPLDMNAQGLELLPDDALRHATAQVLHQQPPTAVLRECEGLENHTLPSSRDRSALTAAIKPLAVDVTTIRFSALSWAVRPPGHDAPKQDRKARVSRAPEMKMGSY